MGSRIKMDGGVDALFKYQKEQVVPQTPEEIKQYRQSYRKQLGQSCIHPKLRVDPNSSSLPKIFGKPLPASDHYSDYFPRDKFVGVENIVNDQREQIYASNSSMPLGKTMDRKYVFPEETSKANFRYGAATKKDEKDAKEVMYQEGLKSSQQDEYRPFFKPISQLDAGEQLNRRYDTKNYNPERKFGVSSVIKADEMKTIIQGENNYGNFKVVDKRQELFQNAKHLHLGMPKSSFILQDNAKRSFMSQSTPSLNIQKLGVPDCLKFKDLTLSDVRSSDVGRSIALGVKSLPKANDNRIYGIPSIRTDVSPPRYISLTNMNNYGNESSACNLLSPFQYSMQGLGDDDFQKLRSREEIRDLIETIGYKYKIGKFLGIYQRAQEIQGNSADKVSLNSFLSAMQELNSIQ